MTEQDGGGYVIEGPSVAVVGWIPYAYDLADMAPNAYTRHRHAHAFGWLFDSGNLAPPDRFDGYEGFRGFLGTKAFRAACCLRNVKLRCNGDGVPTQISYDREEHVGYTPFRYAEPRARRKRTLYHDRGQSALGNAFSQESDSRGMVIVQSIRFRVGWLGNFASLVHDRERGALGLGRIGIPD
jgi:hypothetical protein